MFRFRSDLRRKAARRLFEHLKSHGRDGRNRNGIDEQLLYAARQAVREWGQLVKGFRIDAAIARLKQALAPFEGVREESEEGDFPGSGPGFQLPSED